MRTMMSMRTVGTLAIAVVAALGDAGSGALAQEVLVAEGSPMIRNANASSNDLGIVPQLIAGLPGPDPRGPYIQSATPTSIILRWRTSDLQNSLVEYGPAHNQLTSSQWDPNLRTDHEVLLSDLQPGTTYYYRVGSSTSPFAGGTVDHYFVTPPAAGTRTPVRIWALGDSGTANASAAAVRNAYLALDDVRTDVWLMLGDNAYPNGTDSQYQAAVFDMYPQFLRNTPLWPTLGNHDAASAFSSSLTGPYYDMFTLPDAAEAGGLSSGTEAYYSFDHGNVHFICLNSEDVSRAPGGAMLTWLENDLMATAQDWVIVYWHTPPYSKGSHDSDNASDSGGRLVQMRTNVVPILEAHGVDLVLGGHSHSYERSYLLDGHYGLSNTLTGANLLAGTDDGRIDGDGAYQKATGGLAPHEGAVYIVAGSSGQASGGSLNHPAMFISLNILGSLVLDVNGHRLDGRFLTSQGVISDHFTMTKGSRSVGPEGRRLRGERPDMPGGRRPRGPHRRRRRPASRGHLLRSRSCAGDLRLRGDMGQRRSATAVGDGNRA